MCRRIAFNIKTIVHRVKSRQIKKNWKNIFSIINDHRLAFVWECATWSMKHKHITDVLSFIFMSILPRHIHQVTRNLNCLHFSLSFQPNLHNSSSQQVCSVRWAIRREWNLTWRDKKVKFMSCMSSSDVWEEIKCQDVWKPLFPEFHFTWFSIFFSNHTSKVH